MKRKTWVKIGIGILSVLLIIDIVASFYFYHLAIERGEKDFLQGNEDLDVSAETMDVLLEGGWRTWGDEQNFDEWTMTTNDGLDMKGYFLESEEPSNKVVVMAHGYLGNAMDMGLFGQYYYEQKGYNIFTADARGHGESGGDYIGFGWHDRFDYVDWIDRIIETYGDDTEIILHGISMGAATVLMTAGEDLPDNVKAVIADSPYTSVHDLFAYQMDRMFNLPSFPFLPSTSVVTQMRAGYSLKEASALDQVKQAEVPILYIHGNADTFVPTSMSKTLYENTKSDAELMIVDGANHGEPYVIAEDKYIDKVNAFLGKYTDWE
ncbi:alpha/beta hydrolase [Lentibacillus salicampi]|uniref:Alpha/beta hydrolase n=1 Tax=Lentibacillus salicampi TaxID=175306 RepID=A0A4Y9AA26_9BACI|nr:alpha/beta hydrolase [Lentibacillus salicampi]TFJ92027.1 alpha/beta hydrolase [Lentibacillus salicampi]